MQMPLSEGVRYEVLPDVPGYCVGDDGSVWTRRLKGGNVRRPDRFGDTWQPVRQHTDKKGYRFVNLTANGRPLRRLVHQLVLEAFVGPCPPGCEACHYPSPDKANNSLPNLRWDTHAENMRDKTRDLPPPDTKRCRRCEGAFPAAMFYRDRRSSDGLKTECKRCHLETSVRTRDKAKKRQANREYMRRRRNGQ